MRIRTSIIASLIMSPFLYITAFATTKNVTIQCTPTEGIYRAQFKATATLEIADDLTVKGSVIYESVNKVADAPVDKGTTDVTGNVTVFPPGQLYVNEVHIYKLLSNDEPKKAFTFTAPTHDNFASRFLIDRSREYISHCEYKSY